MVDWANTGVHFFPWVGEKFATTGDRLLVLGESHYGHQVDDSSQFTHLLINNHVTHKTGCRVRFLTKVAKVVASNADQPLQCDDVWQHVAFYNFIQSLVGDRDRIAPTEQQWREAAQPFLRVIDILRPSLVLVLGITRLWNHVKALGKPSDELVIATGEVRQSYAIRLDVGGQVRLFPVHHPSSRGFSYRASLPWMQGLRTVEGVTV